MTLDELERCITTLLALARARGIYEIHKGKPDYYWSVPSPEWTEISKDPELTVGSLNDDLLELEKLLKEPERASSVDFDRVASVLRLLSDRLSS